MKDLIIGTFQLYKFCEKVYKGMINKVEIVVIEQKRSPSVAHSFNYRKERQESTPIQSIGM